MKGPVSISSRFYHSEFYWRLVVSKLADDDPRFIRGRYRWGALPATSRKLAKPFRLRFRLKNSLEFSPDGLQLAVVESGNLTLWDGLTLENFTEISITPTFFAPARFSPDGRWLATAGREIALWDLQTGDLVLVFKGHAGQVLDMVFTTDGSMLVSASEDGTAVVWELP